MRESNSSKAHGISANLIPSPIQVINANSGGNNTTLSTPYHVIGKKNDDLRSGLSSRQAAEREKVWPVITKSGEKEPNNDIRLLTRPKQVRLVKLDLDSPRMQAAMINLGFEKEDLDTKKVREDFNYSSKVAGQTMSPIEYDESIIDLRFRHYQQRLMDRINKVVSERKHIKVRESAKEQIGQMFDRDQQRFAVIKSHSHAALPAIKHQRRGFNATSQHHLSSQQSEYQLANRFDQTNNIRSPSATLILNGKKSLTINTSVQDDLMNQALNRVKESQKKQMKVIQASLQRTEKNNIRQAVREFKEKKIENNIQMRNLAKAENIKTINEKKMERAHKRKQLMSAEKERKRHELLKREIEQMSPIRNKLNMTHGNFNRKSMPNYKFTAANSALFKPNFPDQESQLNSAHVNKNLRSNLPPRPSFTKSGSFAGILKSQSPKNKLLYSGNKLHKSNSNQNSRDLTPKNKQEDNEDLIQNSISRINAKMQKTEQKRMQYQNQKVEKTQQWNQLSDNRNALRHYNETLQDEMRLNSHEEKKMHNKAKIKQRLEEQQTNFDVYKEMKEQHRERILKNKAIQKAEAEKKQKNLVQKVQDDNLNIENFKAQQQLNNTLKQEMRLLKEADLKHLRLQQKRVNEKKLQEMLNKRLQTEELQDLNRKTKEKFFEQLKTENNNVGRCMTELKTAISDVLNDNHYNKTQNKNFLKAMTKQQDIKLPVDPSSVKINRQGKAYVKYGGKRKGKHDQFVPYDIQKGVRVESDRKSDIDEEDNYKLARKLSRQFSRMDI